MRSKALFISFALAVSAIFGCTHQLPLTVEHHSTPTATPVIVQTTTSTSTSTSTPTTTRTTTLTATATISQTATATPICSPVSTCGNINTVAGQWQKLGDTGSGLSATLSQFSETGDIVKDSQGNFIFSDWHNNLVRKFNVSTGIVTTIAGAGPNSWQSAVTFSDGDGGPAVSAHVYAPMGLALDSAGNLYIAERGGEKIRKVNMSTGIITTIAGNGHYCGPIGSSPGTYDPTDNGKPATQVPMGDPWGVAVDNSGNVYFTESIALIRKVDPATGIISVLAGTGGSGVYPGDGRLGTATSLADPHACRLDGQGSLYFADGNNIRKINLTTNILTTVAGNGAATHSGDGGSALAAGISSPMALTFDRYGNLYTGENGQGTIPSYIRRIDHSTNVITTVAGYALANYSGDGGPATLANVNFPKGLAFDDFGNLFVSDQEDSCIREIYCLAP